MTDKRRSEKEHAIQYVRNKAYVLMKEIHEIKENYGVDMTDEIVEYLRSQK